MEVERFINPQITSLKWCVLRALIFKVKDHRVYSFYKKSGKYMNLEEVNFKHRMMLDS